MDVKHLQALIVIADRGSFSAAANALGTVQSNISAHVARLEGELDVALVDRSSGRLTEEGLVVATRGRRVLSELDAIVSDVTSLRREVVGTVRAGMIGTTGRWLVPQIFPLLRERHPHVQLTVADGTSTTLEPQLLSGQLDLVVVTLPVPGNEIVSRPLFYEDLMLVVPADDPFVARYEKDGPLPLALLSERELILPLTGTALRQEIDAVVQPLGIALHSLLELDGLRLIASLAFDGHGPAILPATAVPAHLQGQFRPLPLVGMPHRRVGIAFRNRGMPSAATRSLIDVLYEVVADPKRMPEGVHPSPLAKARR